MSGARYHFYFVDKQPLAVWVVMLLIVANTALMLLPDSIVNHIFSTRAPRAAHWYADHSITIQFVLFVALAALFIIYRKHVHYYRRD